MINELIAPARKSIKTIDLYILNYLNAAKENRTIRGLKNIDFHFEYSKKSDSKYLYLTYRVNNKNYKKRIRISDHHLNGYNGKQFLVNRKIKEWSENIKSNLKSFIKEEIEKFYYGTNFHIKKLKVN